MLHGLTGSLDDFYEFGWVAGLKDDYRLILLDARGHGHSDKPYTPEAFAVIAVLDELWSMFSQGGQWRDQSAIIHPDNFYKIVSRFLKSLEWLCSTPTVKRQSVEVSAFTHRFCYCPPPLGGFYRGKQG
jgi:hypothetical protein